MWVQNVYRTLEWKEARRDMCCEEPHWSVVYKSKYWNYCDTTHPHCPRQGADISLAYQGGTDIRRQADVYHDVQGMWNFHAERLPPPWDI